ncbi:hypothetical protein [Streptomyces sp. WG5]|uniref:hypothetical protein n=1 Tax=Streptomyces sp. WG5 TaxID=3417648 RepID=UPI003CF4FE20
MREKPDDAGEADVGAEVKSKRIDLSVPQVAGSALAAVVAAKLASSFGVYGTILGAGLISVIATCGGSVLQHFFKRTGEQLRVKRPLGAGGADGRGAAVPGEFTAGTVYRARTRGWKRPLVAAALVFGVTMAGITAYEVASGESLGGGHSTTVGSALSGHGTSAPDPEKSDGSGNSQDSEGSQDSGGPGDSGSGSDAPAATPSGTPSGTDGSASPGSGSGEDEGTASSPTPTPDATGEKGSGDATSPDPEASATAPGPGASSRSGTDDPGRGGSAAP